LRLKRGTCSEALVRECARLGATQPSFAVAAQTLERLGRVSLSSSTVWRYHQEVSSQLAEELEKEQKVPPGVDQENVLAMEWVTPHARIETHASVSMDGVKVLLRDEGFREVKIVSVSEVVEETEQAEPDTTAKRCEEDDVVAERPAVGCQKGIKLTRHSYRAILGDKAAFIPALKGELACRRVRQADKISTVNDGADWIWDLVSTYLPGRTVEILDWPHAIENLAKAGNAGWGEGTPEARAWLEQRKTELWNGQLMQVEIGLYHLPRRYKDRGRDIRQVKGYVDRHWQRLYYDRFRAEGRPIGSGTVESAARNVVAWRMKRGGQRWSSDGASRMLVALGEIHSSRWETHVPHLAKAA
jgi:hypothetical protein